MTKKTYTYVAVLDFEANCLDKKLIWPQEITEFPIIFYNLKKRKVEEDKTFHHYCKIDTPLTEFATELTGITQEMCDAGTPFKEVMGLLHQHLVKHEMFTKDGEPRFFFATCGNWDLQTALPKQCEYSKISIPSYMNEWCNIKTLFKHFYQTKPKGMVRMLDHLKIELEGRHHSGIDDTRNTTKIVDRMVNDGCKIKPTSWRY